MSEQDDELNLEALIKAVNAGADRLRDLMLRFEGYEKQTRDEETGEITREYVPGLKLRYSMAVAGEVEEIVKEYERRGERPPPKEIREHRAAALVQNQQPELWADYHGVAGSIATAQKWLSAKRDAISGMQTLNKTNVTLAGMA